MPNPSRTHQKSVQPVMTLQTGIWTKHSEHDAL